MKKLVSFIIVTGILMSLAGCGKGKADAVSAQSVRVEDIKNNVSGIEDIEFAGNIEDSQPYWNSSAVHSVARGEYGYYYVTFGSGGRKILSYMDDETCELIPLCNNAQCDHVNSDCPAVFSDYSEVVWYYKNHIYMIKFSSEGRAVLVQINPDGTDRKELFDIGSVPIDSADDYDLVFNNDCVYVYNNTGNCRLPETVQISIKRFSLDNKINEDIITSDEQSVLFNSVRAYGDKVFFTYSTTEFKKETKQNVMTGDGLYCYNESTGKTTKLIDKNISDYIIDTSDNIIYYYVINEGLYKYKIKDKEENLIYKEERNSTLCYISFDEDYIYLDNTRWCLFTRTADLTRTLYVLDKDGNVINTIETRGRVLFGDDRYKLFEVGKKKEVKYASLFKLAYIKKSEINTADTWSESEWQK